MEFRAKHIHAAVQMYGSLKLWQDHKDRALSFNDTYIRDNVRNIIIKVDSVDTTSFTNEEINSIRAEFNLPALDNPSAYTVEDEHVHFPCTFDKTFVKGSRWVAVGVGCSHREELEYALGKIFPNATIGDDGIVYDATTNLPYDGDRGLVVRFERQKSFAGMIFYKWQFGYYATESGCVTIADYRSIWKDEAIKEATSIIKVKRNSKKELVYDADGRVILTARKNAYNDITGYSKDKLKNISWDEAAEFLKGYGLTLDFYFAKVGIDTPAITNDASADTAEVNSETTDASADPAKVEVNVEETVTLNVIDADTDTVEPADSDTTNDTAPVTIVGSAESNIAIDTPATTKVITDNGIELDVHYQIISIDNTIPSHFADSSASVTENPSYPQELQPRDRESRVQMGLEVLKMANCLRPADLLDSRNLNQGAPVLRNDGVILNGNGRAMAIRLAYELGKADDYCKMVLTTAHKFGIDALNIANIERPILVRVVDTEITAELSNSITTSTAGGNRLSPAEQAKVDAKNLKLHAFNEYYSQNEACFDWTSANNVLFATSILCDINTSPADLNAYISANGKISTEGIRRVQNALVAAAYKDAYIVDNMSESLDDNIKNVSNALKYAAPIYAKLAVGVKAKLYWEYNISTHICEAAKRLVAARKNKILIDAYLERNSLFAEYADAPETLAILAFIGAYERTKSGGIRYIRSAKQITLFLVEIANIIFTQGGYADNALFGDKLSLSEIIKIAAERVTADTQLDLFANIATITATAKEEIEMTESTIAAVDTESTIAAVDATETAAVDTAPAVNTESTIAAVDATETAAVDTAPAVDATETAAVDATEDTDVSVAEATTPATEHVILFEKDVDTSDEALGITYKPDKSGRPLVYINGRKSKEADAESLRRDVDYTRRNTIEAKIKNYIQGILEHNTPDIVRVELDAITYSASTRANKIFLDAIDSYQIDTLKFARDYTKQSFIRERAATESEIEATNRKLEDTITAIKERRAALAEAQAKLRALVTQYPQVAATLDKEELHAACYIQIPSFINATDNTAPANNDIPSTPVNDDTPETETASVEVTTPDTETATSDVTTIEIVTVEVDEYAVNPDALDASIDAYIAATAEVDNAVAEIIATVDTALKTTTPPNHIRNAIERYMNMFEDAEKARRLAATFDETVDMINTGEVDVTDPLAMGDYYSIADSIKTTIANYRRITADDILNEVNSPLERYGKDANHILDELQKCPAATPRVVNYLDKFDAAFEKQIDRLNMLVERVNNFKSPFADSVNDDTPDAPVNDNTPDTPANDDTPTTPVNDDTPPAPVNDDTPTEPVNDNTSDTPEIITKEQLEYSPSLVGIIRDEIKAINGYFKTLGFHYKSCAQCGNTPNSELVESLTEHIDDSKATLLEACLAGSEYREESGANDALLEDYLLAGKMVIHELNAGISPVTPPAPVNDDTNDAPTDITNLFATIYDATQPVNNTADKALEAFAADYDATHPVDNHAHNGDTAERKSIHVIDWESAFELIQRIAPANYQIKVFGNNKFLFAADNGFGFVAFTSDSDAFKSKMLIKSKITAVDFGRVVDNKLQNNSTNDKICSICLGKSNTADIDELRNWFELPATNAYAPIKFGAPVKLFKSTDKQGFKLNSKSAFNRNIPAVDKALERFYKKFNKLGRVPRKNKLIIENGAKSLEYFIEFLVDDNGSDGIASHQIDNTLVNPNGGLAYTVFEHVDAVFGNHKVYKGGVASVRTQFTIDFAFISMPHRVTGVTIVPVIEADYTPATATIDTAPTEQVVDTPVEDTPAPNATEPANDTSDTMTADDIQALITAFDTAVESSNADAAKSAFDKISAIFNPIREDNEVADKALTVIENIYAQFKASLAAPATPEKKDKPEPTVLDNCKAAFREASKLQTTEFVAQADIALANWRKAIAEAGESDTAIAEYNVAIDSFNARKFCRKNGHSRKYYTAA